VVVTEEHGLLLLLLWARGILVESLDEFDIRVVYPWVLVLDGLEGGSDLGVELLGGQKGLLVLCLVL
jgi:hypothetical protein